MAFLTGFLTFWKSGGWKIFVAIGVAVGLFLSVSLIVGKLEELGRLQVQFQQVQNQQNADIKRIGEQNEENRELLQSVRNNTATIGVLRSQLAELGSTITPDIDASAFETSLEAIIRNQYTCMERISRDETNATCV